MKLILLQHLSGADGVYEVDDKMDVDDATAIRFINKGIAKATSQKAHNELVTRVEKHEEEEAEKEAKVTAIRKEDDLKTKADDLFLQLMETVDIIATMDSEYRAEFLAKFHASFVEDEQNNEGDLVDNSGTGANKDAKNNDTKAKGEEK